MEVELMDLRAKTFFRVPVYRPSLNNYDFRLATDMQLANDIAKTIRHEQARSDRYGHKLTVIVFATKCGDKASIPVLDMMLNSICDRIRVTDTAGWLSQHSVAVVLPDTSTEGAESLVRDIVSVNKKDICYTIYSYPSPWFDSDNDVNNEPHGNDATSPPIASKSNPALLLKRIISTCFMSSAPTNAAVIRTFPWWKRCVDILASLLALIILAPLLLGIAIHILIVSPGPILFSQTRLGYKKQAFKIFKFRTMQHNADTELHQQSQALQYTSEVPMVKLDAVNDPRLIPMARIIRAAGLDELPQLFNVLRGEMSLVGPRPCLPYEAEYYSSWQTRRFNTLPGITGLWQVSGKNRTTFKQMIRLDIRYIEKLSFRLDLIIMLKTLPTLMGQLIGLLSKRLSGITQGDNKGAENA